MIHTSRKANWISLWIGLITSGTAVSGQITGLAGWDILLDPGHSQEENMGIFNYPEAHKNLRVALEVQDLLLTKTDIDAVYMSRTDDQQQVGLSQRTDLANQLGTAWFHSIHSNAGGPTVNNALLLYGEPKEKTSLRGGKAMSEIMVVHLANGMRIPSIGARGECQFYYGDPNCTETRNHVNRESNMPSELSEAGFHTNPTQNQLNMNAKWKRLEAYTFFWSILEYHGIPRPQARILTGIVTDVETGEPVNGATLYADGKTYTTDTHQSLFRYYSGDPELLRNGFYFLEDLTQDTVELIVDGPGFFADTLQVALSGSFFTFRDIQLSRRKYPWIITSTPSMDDSTRWINDPITISFSQPMDRASVLRNISISNGALGWTHWTADGTELMIIPDSLEPSNSYTLIIDDAASDTSGLGLDGDNDFLPGGDFRLEFTTGTMDLSPPVLVASYPAKQGEIVRTEAVFNFYFNELLDTLSLVGDEIRLRRSTRYQYFTGRQVHTSFMDRSLLTFIPDEPLEPGEEYRLILSFNPVDRQGNSGSQEFTLTFECADEQYFVTPLEHFHGDVLGRWTLPLGDGDNPGLVENKTKLQLEIADEVLPGEATAALRLDYRWQSRDEHYLLQARLKKEPPESKGFNSNYSLKYWLYGDASGNEFSITCLLSDATTGVSSNILTVEVPIDWVGWRSVVVPLERFDLVDDFNNPSLTSVVQLAGMSVTHPPGSTEQGTLMLGAISLAYQHSGNEPALPAKARLYAPYPNPFNSVAMIPFDVALPARISLVVFDLLGRKVTTLLEGNMAPGSFTVTWFGSGGKGQMVPSGVYFIRLQGADFRKSMTVTLIK